MGRFHLLAKSEEHRKGIARWLYEQGWCVRHYDFRTHTFTLERRRRFFRGRYEVVHAERLEIFLAGGAGR